MDAEPRDLQELRELRRRVCGPVHDLAQDPAAHARLAELESARAPAPAALAAGGAGGVSGGPAGPAGAAAADARPVVASAPEEAPHAEPEPDAVPGPPPSRIDRLRARLTPRTTRVLQAAALILALAGTAAATAWITREPGETVAVLPLRTEVGISLDRGEASPGGEVRTAEFHGLTLARLPGDSEEPQITDDCLSVQETAGSSSTTVGAYSCGAGEVPARVPLNVTDELPAELQEAFPLGTTLVFDLEDEVVRVRALSR